MKKILLVGVLVAACFAIAVGSFQMARMAGKGGVTQASASIATPEGITLQPLGRAQGYDLGKQTAALILREQIAFADAKGMTLYTYEKDEPGKSNCSGDCLKNWPALAASGDAKAFGPWSIIAREDGSRQWAYRSKPLYTFIKDVDPGSVGGNSPARTGARRKDGAGNAVGGGVRGGGARDGNGGEGGLSKNWKVATAFPVADLSLPEGLAVREVPDALALVLVDYRDHTLYMFDGDPREDRTGCATPPCHLLWKPVAAPQLAGDGQGDFAAIMRPDGFRQWSYKGRGLYTYDGDLAVDDANGIGVDKKWDVAAIIRFALPAGITVRTTPGQGKILATAEGMTLYRRDGYILQSGGGHNLRRGQPLRPAVGRDIGTDARCDDACRKSWHPFLASADARPQGFWSIATRDDGARQWVYQGYALWTYSGDRKPGDMTGNDMFDIAFANDASKGDEKVTGTIDLGTPMDGAAGLYWAIVPL